LESAPALSRPSANRSDTAGICDEIGVQMFKKEEICFQEQEERIRRLSRIVLSDNPSPLLGILTYYDVVMFTFQSMWHLKDWILNDPEFGAKNTDQLKRDIHSNTVLLICADIANGTKHLLLSRPRSGAFICDQQGVHLDSSKGIYQTYYYVVCADSENPYHGMEVRDVITAAQQAWDKIIQTHYLTTFV
jgi:hypothetical protein